MDGHKEQLLAKAKQGDHEALGDLLRELQPQWLALARHKKPGRAHDAEDLVASMMERLLSSPKPMEAYEDVNHLFSFGNKVMHNIHVDETRKHYSLKRGGGAPHLSVNTRDPESPNTDVADKNTLSPAEEAMNREHQRLIAQGLSKRQQALLANQSASHEQGQEPSERTQQRDWASIRRRSEEVLGLSPNSIKPNEPRKR